MLMKETDPSSIKT